MHSNRAILSKLLLRLMHLSEEVNEPFAALGHALLRPVRELELADGAGSSVARVSYLDDDLQKIILFKKSKSKLFI